MAKRTASFESLNRQLLALRNRVMFLEMALRKARQKPSQLPAIAERRDRADDSARRSALNEYYAQRRIQRFRENPWLLESEQQSEDDRNGFLRSRGLQPDPTEIPKEFRKQARALVANKRRQPKLKLKPN